MFRYQQFDEGEWGRTACSWTAWWQGEIDRPMVVIEKMTDERYDPASWYGHLIRFPSGMPALDVVDCLTQQLIELSR